MIHSRIRDFFITVPWTCFQHSLGQNSCIACSSLVSISFLQVRMAWISSLGVMNFSRPFAHPSFCATATPTKHLLPILLFEFPW